MTQWGAFLAVAALLTVVVLVLARASQPALRDGDDTSAAEPPTEVDTTEGREPVPSLAPETDEKMEPTGEPGADTEGLPTEEVTGHLAAERTENARRPEPSPGGAKADIGDLSTGMLLANVALTQGVVAVAVIVAAWYFAIPATAMGIVVGALDSSVGIVVGGVAFGAMLWVGNELSTRVADVVGAAYDESVRSMLAPESVGGWVLLLGVVLPLIAVSEELLFRAALIGVPAAGYGVSPWLLAILSSVAFALGHGAQGRVGIVVTGVLGFVLAAGYILSGNLLFVIVAHYVINAMEFLVHEGPLGPLGPG